MNIFPLKPNNQSPVYTKPKKKTNEYTKNTANCKLATAKEALKFYSIQDSSIA
jgi:hypothetical protein